MPIKLLNCTQCGTELNLHFKHSKLIQCPSCKSTLFLEDESVTNFGEKSSLSQETTLLQLNKEFNYKGWYFRPIGKIRYAYELGFWEEWFVLDKEGQESWISVDEGDFVIEKALELNVKEIIETMSKRVGQTVKIQLQEYLISEKEQGVTQGFEGELARVIKPNTKLDYMHLTATKKNQHITLEKENGNYSAYIGEWIDAYKIESL